MSWAQSKARLLSQRPALELIDLINRKVLAPKDMETGERLNVVETLRMEGWGQAKIAHLLKVSHNTVKRDVAVLKARMRPLLARFTKDRVAAESIGLADALRQRALASGNVTLAWQITKELPELIQSLGLLERAAVKHELELRQQFFVAVIQRSKETHEHVDGNGVVGPSRN